MAVETRQESGDRRLKNSLLNRRILITGASSGIGEALARRCASAGAEVIILSDHIEGLLKVQNSICEQGGKCQVYQLDLSSSTEVEGALVKIEAKYGAIDSLINNAGVGLGATLLQTTATNLRFLFEVNFFSLHTLCKDAFDLMSTRGKGWIVNVTSAAARCGSPGVSAYSASKGAVHALTQAFRIESYGTGVEVSECLPISVKTNFFNNVRGEQYKPEGVVLQSDHVADVIANAITRPHMPAEILPFRPIRLAFIIEATVPWIFSRYSQIMYFKSIKKAFVEQRQQNNKV